jgi:xanthine dehydrogenase accessory factor
MGEETEVFIRAWGRQPRLIIIGAIDFSVALAKFARDLQYATTIVDAREAFLASQRFTAYAEVVRQWPHEYLSVQSLNEDDVVLVFSHDSKFDEPALLAALRTDAGFIGAMGSRKTVTDRTHRLQQAGVSDAELERIVSPVGLDIGPVTPAETAVSILAEILMRRSQRTGLSLSRTAGSIRSGRADPPQQSSATADSVGISS